MIFPANPLIFVTVFSYKTNLFAFFDKKLIKPKSYYAPLAFKKNTTMVGMESRR